MKTFNYPFWIVGAIALFYPATCYPTSAQIVPDATLPVNSVVTPQDSSSIISGGTAAGTNLFHSFREFSIPAGNTAYFNNAVEIQNIITRVTGGKISNINGILKANGSANLFLLNPSGIIFGPNASLDIGGSFLASSASSIKLADGNEFSATNPQAPPLLTVNVPVGLQFGANPGGIVVQGSGHNFTANPQTDATIRNGRQTGLAVLPGQTLAIAGGDISLIGGNLTAEGGRIELASAGSGSYLALTPTNPGWMLEYSGVQTFQDIQLSQAASADVSGPKSGAVRVAARRVTLSDGSAILAIAQGAEPGGNASVFATESVELTGTTAAGDYSSGIYAQVDAIATGQGGNLTIETARLSVRDGATANTSTAGAGNGGSLTVKASESVEVSGTAANGSLSSSLSANTSSTGKAGNLTVETGRLSVSGGATVAASTFSAGDGGNLTVKASDSIELSGTAPNGKSPARILARAESGSTGKAGNLMIETARLSIRDGATVSTSTSGAGDGGTLSVKASESVEVIGTTANSRFSSSLQAIAAPNSTGNGGSVTIETSRLSVQNGGFINASTFGAGNGGSLSVKASESVEVSGTSADGQGPTSLIAQAERGSTGKAGNLTIATARLSVRDGASVSTSTFGAGDGGSLNVQASESVEVSGSRSGLYASSREGSGNGGNLTIATARLNVNNGGKINVSSSGTGAAGNLSIDAAIIRFDSGAVVAAETSAGSQGNITVNSADIQLRNGSNITTNARGTATGGNIAISADTLAALENSDISANSEESFGGRVTVSSQGIFGTEFRDNPSPDSDITASSRLGASFSGTVTLNTPDIKPAAGLGTLQASFVDASRLIFPGCEAYANSSFTVTGSGGLPPNPEEPLSSSAVVVEWARQQGEGAEAGKTTFREAVPVQIVEATGIAKSADGKIILTADSATGTSEGIWYRKASCAELAK